MADIDVTFRGPVFDGRSGAAVDDFCRASEGEIAQEGVNVVRAQLRRVLRNPTGYYESQIQTDRAAASSLVTDGDVVYGPWLAGVGSRNATTRFKGYAHWRRATQQLQARAASIAEGALGPFLRRMQ